MKTLLVFFKIFIISFFAWVLTLIFTDPNIRPVFYATAVMAAIIWVNFKYLNRNNQGVNNLVLAVGFTITIIGWFVNSYIENKLDTEKTKKELRVKYLLNAYYRIENAANRYNGEYHESDIDSYIFGKYSESALGGISLLADTQTIRLANEYILDNKGIRNSHELLTSLRNELRNELDLMPVPNNSVYNLNSFRIFRKNPMNDSMTSEQQIDFIIKLNELNNY
jgi:hypothetical protein